MISEVKIELKFQNQKKVRFSYIWSAFLDSSFSVSQKKGKVTGSVLWCWVGCCVGCWVRSSSLLPLPSHRPSVVVRLRPSPPFAAVHTPPLRLGVRPFVFLGREVASSSLSSRELTPRLPLGGVSPPFSSCGRPARLRVGDGLGCLVLRGWVVRWFGFVWWCVGLGGWVAGQFGSGECRGVRSFRFFLMKSWTNRHTEKPQKKKTKNN